MSACQNCRVALPAGALVCPVCRALVHKDELESLARQAEAASDPSEALARWRTALTLLPEGSRQHAQIAERVATLSKELDKAPSSRSIGGTLGGLGVVGAVLWKFKAVILLALGKLKFLGMGLAKLPTLLSMFASFGVYTMLWGWKFAAGFVLAIYVHEIGHVVALRRFGIAATAPMFIPGFGAFVRLKQYPATPREDARVGIAGPIWGTAAAAFALGLGMATGSVIFHAIGATAAIINLFNLLPIGSLDGGRAYRGMSRTQRLVVGAVAGAGWLAAGTPMTMLVALGMIGRTLIFKDEPAEGDVETTVSFAAVVALLTWMGMELPAV